MENQDVLKRIAVLESELEALSVMRVGPIARLRNS